MARYPSKLYGITGFPLGHSISPALQNWAFQERRFPGVYLAWPEPPEKLGAFFQAVRTLPVSGGNITIPHKEASIKYLDHVSARAKSIGAVNTFFWRDGELWGDNTDITGFLGPLKGRSFKSALILGAGGAARAVIAGLKEIGTPEIIITNRTFAKAQELAAFFGAEALPWDERGKPRADLIVNATSMGMSGRQEDQNPYEESWMRGREGLAYDIVYNPPQTLFLKAAEASGWKTENGLAMFVGQARAAFALWTEGLEMPREAAMQKAAGLLGL